MATRIDFGTLRPPKRLPNGQLRVDGLLTKSGVFEYRNSDGTMRKEYRPPEEVFKTDSLETFALVPVTDDHPPVMVDSRNARQFAVGSVGEVIRRDGDHVSASIMVFDAATIEKMEAGKVQLSCGYEADIIDQPGITPEGERYDAIQRNIKGNHVALVQVGRAGPEARVRMDAYVMITDEMSQDKTEQKPNGVPGMEELKKELGQALAQIAKLEVRADAAEQAVTAEKARADKAEAERDSAKAELEAADKARKDAQDSIATNVRERVALERAAGAILGDTDVTAMSDRDIKVAVVKKVDGVELDAEKSDVYVSGRFDSAVERSGKGQKALAEVRKVTEDTRNDSSESREDAARKKMLEANKNAWKAEK